MADPALQGIPEGDILQLVYKSTINITSTGSGSIGTQTVNHNLGFTPLILAYIQDSGARTPLPAILSYGLSASAFTIDQYIYIQNVTTTSVTFQFAKVSSGSQSFTIVYYLYRNKISNS